MLPEYPQFELLEATRREALAPYLALARQPICDLSMANLCIWRECERATYTFIEGHLCIRIQPHDQPAYFLEPLGPGSVLKVAALCLNHTERISHASEAMAAEMPPEFYQTIPLRDHFDYLYQVAEIAELKGNKHDGKRNQIKKFIRQNPGYQLAPLAEHHREQAFAVFERWFQQRSENGTIGDDGAASDASIACQRLALERAFDDFDNLSLSGLAVFTEGRMHGLLLGSPLTAETAVIHFLYADSQLRGIYQLLLQESCRTVFAAYRLVNLEEDLGIPTLRRTKMSYNPLRLEKKFLITPRIDNR
jgi:uncharacterized protein